MGGFVSSFVPDPFPAIRWCFRTFPLLLGGLWLLMSGMASGDLKPDDENAAILVVMRDESPAHSEFLDGLLACYKRSEDSDTTIRRVPVAEYDVADVPQTAEVVIAVGVEATRSVLDHQGTELTFISALVPEVSTQHLLGGEEGKHYPDSVFFLDQPLSRRLSLIRSLLPKAKTLGVVLGPNSGFYEVRLKREASRYGFGVELGYAGSEQELPQTLPSVLEKSDALLVLYDPVLTEPNAIRFLLYSAYQRQVPVFGYSEGYVDAGALAAVYSTAPELGCQVGGFLERRSGTTSRTSEGVGMEVHYPVFFQFRLNRSVARAFPGVTGRLPDNQSMLEGLSVESP